MIRQIKAELLKLFTVRSTYGILAFCLAGTFLYAFYVQGYLSKGVVTDPYLLYTSISGTLTTLSFLIGLFGALLVTNEYRYNTIMYTLVLSNSRRKVLLAKAAAVSVLVISVGLLFAVLAPLLTLWGVHAKGYYLVGQTLPVFDLLWRVIFFSWSYALLAMIIAVLIRSQIGTIITLFIVPGTAETLLGFILKDNVVYLPFMAVISVLNTAPVVSFTHGKAALVVLAYLVVAGAAATYVFERRDAS